MYWDAYQVLKTVQNKHITPRMSYWMNTHPTFFFCVMFIVYGGVVTYMRHYFIYMLLKAPSAPLSLGPHMHRQRPSNETPFSGAPLDV